MKDNTAAVHVQVPVEVTSFLLNEKRTEITKIELKQRVTVLLVPNKALETPNYRLERLRHDDPRLENLQASYTMIDEPEEEVGITRREKGKAKQEPVIKGILPETPAPKPAERPQPVAAAPSPAPTAASACRWRAPAAPRRAGRRRLLRLGQGPVRRAGDEPAAAPLKALPAPAATPAAKRRDAIAVKGDAANAVSAAIAVIAAAAADGRWTRERGERGERRRARVPSGGEAPAAAAAASARPIRRASAKPAPAKRGRARRASRVTARAARGPRGARHA